MTVSAHSVSPPTGRRRVTPAMARAQIVNEMAPMSEAARGAVIVAFKRGARAMGLPRPVIELVCYLVSRTRTCDWQDGGRPVAFPSNRDLEVELGVGRSRIKALVRQSAELGLLLCADSPTGRRYGRRDRDSGQLTVAYGFDLSPLSRRHPEFLRAIAAQEEREREAQRLRRHVMVQRQGVLALVECARRAGVADRELAILGRDAEQVALLRQDEWDPGRLSAIAQRLDELLDAARSRLSVVLPDVESDPVGAPKVAPITTTNPPAPATASRRAEGRSASSAMNDVRSSAGASPASARVADCPLRGFQASPALLLQIAPVLRDLVPSSRPSEPQIVEAAATAAGSLGISPHAWGQACHVLGRYAAAVVVAIIAFKGDRGQVRSAGGYMRRLTANHADGTLHLDRTLFGIIEELGVRGHA